jgi:hypothetical protein
MIAGAWTRFTSDPAGAVFTPNVLWSDRLAPVDWLVACWGGDLMMHGAAWLVSAGLVRRAGGWRTELSLINDFEFFSRLMLATGTVRFCDAARSLYRSNLPGSLSGTTHPRGWESAFQSLSLGTARLLAAEDSPRTRDACAVAFRNFYFNSYPDQPGLRALADARIRELGLSLGRPRGGPAFEAVAGILGWRIAKRAQRLVYRKGYRELVARLP